MNLLDLLADEAVHRGLLSPDTEIDAAIAFALVRDMPYRRASDRRPETTIREWQGTCSGKHYLLQALLAELDLPSQIIACTTVVPVDRADVPEHLLPLYESANRRFVDVHNYLLVTCQGASTWLSMQPGRCRRPKPVLLPTRNSSWGRTSRLPQQPLESWPIPPGRDPQDFKDELLQTHFTPAELLFREEVIRALGERTSRCGWVKTDRTAQDRACY